MNGSYGTLFAGFPCKYECTALISRKAYKTTCLMHSLVLNLAIQLALEQSVAVVLYRLALLLVSSNCWWCLIAFAEGLKMVAVAAIADYLSAWHIHLNDDQSRYHGKCDEWHLKPD